MGDFQLERKGNLDIELVRDGYQHEKKQEWGEKFPQETHPKEVDKNPDDGQIHCQGNDGMYFGKEAEAIECGGKN